MANFMDTQTSVDLEMVNVLRERFGEALQIRMPVGKYTSARVGGSAELLLTVDSADDLLDAADMAYTLDIPYVVIGGGSNILVADAGIGGLTILNRARAYSFRHTGVNVVCTAESGVNISSLTRKCLAAGLGGLEWAIGVPGTVGGAVVGNSGAHGSNMAANLRSAMIWEPGLGVRHYTLDMMEYDYRDSVLKREQKESFARRVVLSAEIELVPEKPEILQARAEAFNTHRKNTQPGGATLGSMFKNPEHYYAGYLIEAAGLKGARIGGAHVSEKHANFFLNDEKAQAEDIRALIAEAWHTVRDDFGVELELEVELVGNWSFDE